jgi:DNA-binding response OmpR family regulator
VPEHPRVLVVDDDSSTEKILASRLRKYGVDTLYAPDAVHGCGLAGKEKPSAIIVDNFIPDGDAKYLLHRLRSALATARVPVVVMSRRPLDAAEEQRLKHEISALPGAVHIIKKSFDTNELFGVIRRFCSFAKHVDGVEPPVPTAPAQYFQQDDALTQ